MKSRGIILVGGALALAAPVLALAQNQPAGDGAQLYVSKACVSCHGQGADKPIMPTYPKLGGQNADYAYNQMQDIKSGARNNGQSAAMRAVVQAVSDQELRAIANWLATLPPGGGTPGAAAGAGAPAAGGSK